MLEKKSKIIHNLIIVVLILSGETIFLLPFLVPRIFRPTFLEVFQLTNLELGFAFSVYGIVAMVCYFFGGPLADRWSAKKMMSLALGVTGMSGFLFATMPSISTLSLLYGFWGMTTVLLFWAAMIKATRSWGGSDNQGLAYGLLDAGRGLFAAVVASISVMIFASMLPEDVFSATTMEKRAALSNIIYAFSCFMLFMAAIAWIIIPGTDGLKTENKSLLSEWTGVYKIIKNPLIWFHAMIILCAYVGYKCTDDFSLYASDAYGYDDVRAAEVGTISYWVRPLVTILAGIWADRISSSKVLIFSFIVMLAGSLVITFGWVPPGIHIWLILTVAITSVGIYACRGVYFALFQEADIPMRYTGSAIGVVSVIGFTPDIFMGPLMGVLLDNNPGALGHQYVFGVLAGFSMLGMLSVIIFRRLIPVPNQ